MTKNEFDLLVIGGGSGGLAGARRAAKHGAQVALVEADKLGGTCVNRGCVPKKIFWNAAGIAEAARDAESYGFAPIHPEFQWERFVDAREAYIARLNDIYARNLEVDGVHCITGRARLLGEHRVQVGERVLVAEHILLATGARPQLPDVIGAELGLDSDGFFALRAQPERVAVVGAGYVAVELAGVLHTLGTEVTVLLRRDRPLRAFDRLLGDTLLEEMTTQGIRVVTGFEPARL